jgi:hypothetical protein
MLQPITGMKNYVCSQLLHYFLNITLFLLITFLLTLSYDIKDIFAVEIPLPYSCWEHQDDCVSLLDWEDSSDKKQVAFHVLHSKLQFPRKVYLACYFCNQF